MASDGRSQTLSRKRSASQTNPKRTRIRLFRLGVPSHATKVHASELTEEQPAMSPDDIEIRYCQFVEDVLNHRHLDALATYMTADADSRAGARQLIETLVNAFPDLHLTIDSV